MRILITGADGFIGKNLRTHLSEKSGYDIVPFTRATRLDDLASLVGQSDFVFHLAGVNRSDCDADFLRGNVDLTRALCDAVRQSGRPIPIAFTSSVHASSDTIYGRTKALAEECLVALAGSNGSAVHLFRLPGVFGKWSRPNYNSVVATFCHNIAHRLPIQISDRNKSLELVYIDAVVAAFVATIASRSSGGVYNMQVTPQFRTTLGDLADQITEFRESRRTLLSPQVGVGLARALYATYVSFLPVREFSYELPEYRDARGVFVEMLKTTDSGQFSYFTAYPGVTRGGHYHHTKTEKFLVLKGSALFRFRHLITGETVELRTTGGKPQIVDTVPGWAHDITNVGDEEMVVMLWASEVFDRLRPDTVTRALS